MMGLCRCEGALTTGGRSAHDSLGLSNPQLFAGSGGGGGEGVGDGIFKKTHGKLRRS